MGRPLKIAKSTSVDTGFNNPEGLANTYGVVGGATSIGGPQLQIAATVWIENSLNGIAPAGAPVSGFIVRQKGARKFLVQETASGAQGVCYLVNGMDGQVVNSNWDSIDGTGDGTPATATAAATTTSGSGTGLTVDVTYSGTSAGAYTSSNLTVTVVDAGTGYAAGDEIVIAGTEFGAASPANDITLVIATGGAAAAGVAGSMTVQMTTLMEGSLFLQRLSNYYGYDWSATPVGYTLSFNDPAPAPAGDLWTVAQVAGL